MSTSIPKTDSKMTYSNTLFFLFLNTDLFFASIQCFFFYTLSRTKSKWLAYLHFFSVFLLIYKTPAFEGPFFFFSFFLFVSINHPRRMNERRVFVSPAYAHIRSISHLSLHSIKQRKEVIFLQLFRDSANTKQIQEYMFFFLQYLFLHRLLRIFCYYIIFILLIFTGSKGDFFPTSSVYFLSTKIN